MIILSKKLRAGKKYIHREPKKNSILEFIPQKNREEHKETLSLIFSLLKDNKNTEALALMRILSLKIKRLWE